ncbi:SWIM zinc finger family protein [Paenibacillus sp. N5-1-1-5]|uniref:SWIM zinc finger family protein n=2 Tax=Paenibacillus radicis (ex Xue et al. 2023) TaxID=2972489 RepID=A0ABT1YS16_9BACL|nr:SWIM zinc finger family protein [Paenibacillus radicis (ex Xue et al. 2023)]
MVERFHIDSDSTVQAIIYGSNLYKVRLDMKRFSSSECSCPYNGYCKHMAAVIYEAVRQAGLQPIQFLTPDRKLIIDSKPAANNKSADTLEPVQAEMDLGEFQVVTSTSNRGISNPGTPVYAEVAPKAVKRVTFPKESGSVADWHLYFDKKFGNYAIYSSGALDKFFLEVSTKLLVFGEGWSPLTLVLYEIHVLLFTMKRADELQQQMERNYSYHSHTFGQGLRNISKQCYERFIALDSQSITAEVCKLYPNHLRETASFLSVYGSPIHSSMMPWRDTYNLLWWGILRDKNRIRDEKIRLELVLNHPQINPRQQQDISMKLALFDVIEGNDEQAMQRTKKLVNRQPGWYVFFLQALLSNQDWDRLIHWLKWLRPLVQSSGTSHMELYFHYWQEAAKHQELEEEWLGIVCSMLPSSFTYYSGYLLKHQKYRQWIDLQMIFERTPFEIEKESLKLIEAHDKNLLLPLYHFSVERFILQKNRVAYKSAARLLKKLNQYYKQLGELEYWNQYLLHIKKQFSRYRAFQEELQKGKLIQ